MMTVREPGAIDARAVSDGASGLAGGSLVQAPSSNSDMATADVTLDIRAPEEVMVVAMLSPAQNSWIRGNS